MRLTPTEIWLILLGAFLVVCLLILLMGAVADRIEEQQRNARCLARLRREFERETRKEVYR